MIVKKLLLVFLAAVLFMGCGATDATPPEAAASTDVSSSSDRSVPVDESTSIDESASVDETASAEASSSIEVSSSSDSMPDDLSKMDPQDLWGRDLEGDFICDYFDTSCTVVPLLSGTNAKTIGQYGVAVITKSDFMETPYEDVKKCFECVSSYKDIFNYYVIVFEDETGILFPNCLPYAPCYGAIDSSHDFSVIGDGFTIDDRDTYFSLISNKTGEELDLGEEPFGVNGIFYLDGDQ